VIRKRVFIQAVDLFNIFSRVPVRELAIYLKLPANRIRKELGAINKQLSKNSVPIQFTSEGKGEYIISPTKLKRKLDLSDVHI
jgi:hypothetical protein